MRNHWVRTGLLALTCALLGRAALAGPRATAGEKAAPQKKIASAPSPSKGRVFHTPEPPGEAKLGDVWVSPKDGGEMVYVPAGEFLMGSAENDEDAQSDEKPQFRAYLQAYWIDKCEVTVAQYRRFCRATGRKMPVAPPWGWRDNDPVVKATWYDALAYAQWAGERLPTEAEWEKAARGTDGRTYPWGSMWDAGKCANRASSPGGVKPVGRYPSGASPYGARDMAGNVGEWCEDWYKERAYQRYATGDLTPPASGSAFVLRGGTWFDDDPRSFRCADRYSLPDYLFGSTGIRCVRGPA